MEIPAVSLSAPYTVFPLSLPLHQSRSNSGEGGNYRSCYTSPVESRKRKRPVTSNEIATAVDGEGVNIYDVRSTQTISSYALPPTTRFSCAPSSTVNRISKVGAFRRTYAALSAPKKQLMCWEETSDGNDADRETPVKQRTAGRNSAHDIVYIQDLSTIARGGKHEDTQLDSGLLTVSTDSHIQLFSENLQASYYDFTLPSQKTHKTTIVYAAPTSPVTARKSLFKNLSYVKFSSEESKNIILLVVSKNTVKGKLAYYVSFVSVPVVGGKGNPQELVFMQLRGSTSATSIFSVHFPTATLYQLSSTLLTTYDLTTSPPTIIAKIPIQSSELTGAHPTSLVQISPSSVLVATNDEISLYDTQFSSLQATVSIQPPVLSLAAASGPETPASTGGAGLTGSMFLSTYIQDMDLVIGYAQSGIVGIQLTRSRAEKKGLLIDSLGRGVGNLDAKTSTIEGSLMMALERERKKARKSFSAMRQAGGNVAEFERAFAKYVGLTVIDKPNPSEEEDTQMTNGIGNSSDNNSKAVTDETEFEYPESAYKTLRTDFVATVLSMIFTVTKPSSVGEEQHMKIRIFPPNVLRYLLGSGNFSVLSLPLNKGLVEALFDYDRTLRTLQWFLSTLNDLPVSEILSAVQLALSSSTTAPESENHVIFEIHRAEVVRIALIRLATFPTSVIVKSLQSIPSDTLILLIKLLENELIVGEDGFDEPGKTIGLEDVRVVADLLTAAIDAVGMSGLIMTETTEMLSGLMENVDEALEMVEQAAGLKGLMEELFRHVDWRDVVAYSPLENVDGPADRQKPKPAKQIKAPPTNAVSAPTTEVATKPTTSKALVTFKKQPAVMRPGKNKKRRERGDRGKREVQLAKINSAQRKPIVGHKKMLKRAAYNVSKEELIKQDRPVALNSIKGVSPILPLGALALRRLVDPLVGVEFKADGAEGKRYENMKKEYWREGLAAGTYSMESMVV